MTHGAPDGVDPRSLAAIAIDVWSTMLDRDLEPGASGAAGSRAGQTIDGVVAITGGWCGAVVLRVSRPLATQIAQSMFELGGEPPTLADIQDAVGELTNTTGGNIKGLMPGFCHLSLPTVVDGADFRVRLPGATVVADLHFQCGTEPVVVQLVAARPAQPEPAEGPSAAGGPDERR